MGRKTGGTTFRDLIFVSYSHADAIWLKRLKTHLKPYERKGTIEVWDDQRIRVGTRWRNELRTALERARVAVLLVSPDFLASDFIAENELPRLLSAANGLPVVWVPVRPSSFEVTEINDYRATLDPERSLAEMDAAEADRALVGIVKQIQEIFRTNEQATNRAGVDNPLAQEHETKPTSSALASGRKLVRFFLSYAYSDRSLADLLMADLRRHFSAAARYEYELWANGVIPLGKRWRASIGNAVQACDFGLLLMSPAFLGSKYIQGHELSSIVDGRTAKPILPVRLARLDLNEHDLHGLGDHQLFPQHGRRSFFGDLQGRSKGEFVMQLFVEIQERLDAYFSGLRKDHD